MNNNPEYSREELPEEPIKFTSSTLYSPQLMEELIQASHCTVPVKPEQSTSKQIIFTPKHYIIFGSLILFSLGALNLWNGYPLGHSLFALAPWALFMLLLIMMIHRKPSDQQIKASLSLHQNPQTIHFYEEYLFITSSQPGYSTSLSIYFSMLAKIVETPRCFFFFLPTNSCIVAEKAFFSTDSEIDPIQFLRSHALPHQYVYYTPPIPKKTKN